MIPEIEIITKNTLVPIGMALCFAGGAGWLARIHLTIKNHDKKLEHIEKIYITLNKINERLARMEGKTE